MSDFDALELSDSNIGTSRFDWSPHLGDLKSIVR